MIAARCRKISMAGGALALAAALTLTAPPSLAGAPEPTAEAQDEGPSTPYYQGRMRIGASGGGTFLGDGRSVFHLSVAFGVFVVDNLELGVDTTLWFGDPFAAQLGTGLRYIIPATREVHPYFGAFYRHWFIGGGLPDLDGVGARAGVMINAQPFYLQIGVAHEWLVAGCERDCSEWYPEIGVSFLF